MEFVRRLMLIFTPLDNLAFLQHEKISNGFVPDGTMYGGAPGNFFANVKVSGSAAVEIEGHVDGETAGALAADDLCEVRKSAGGSSSDHPHRAAIPGNETAGACFVVFQSCHGA